MGNSDDILQRLREVERGINNLQGGCRKLHQESDHDILSSVVESSKSSHKRIDELKSTIDMTTELITSSLENSALAMKTIKSEIESNAKSSTSSISQLANKITEMYKHTNTKKIMWRKPLNTIIISLIITFITFIIWNAYQNIISQNIELLKKIEVKIKQKTTIKNDKAN